MTEWKGWSVAGTVLYVSRPQGSEHIGLFMQYGQEVYQLGGFLDEGSAAQFQDWMAVAMVAPGLANAELMKACTCGARHG